MNIIKRKIKYKMKIHFIILDLTKQLNYVHQTHKN